MKFAHLADSHIGAYKEPKLRDLGMRSFTKVIDRCIDEKVDFIVFSGDLFNTSLPSIDSLKDVVTLFNKLKSHHIPVYMIAGSHDYSPSGKTMLDVLEEAGLFINVVKGSIRNGKLSLTFTIDPKTGAKIVGILGKKGTLEKKYYEQLDYESLENEDGFKIFMFHTAIHEYKPKGLENMDGISKAFLPKNFDYYAGGHVHYVFEKDRIYFPGPTFPNNFKELEDLQKGGFYLYDDGVSTHIPIELKSVYPIHINCTHLNASQVHEKALNELSHIPEDSLVLMRFYGVISEGRITDIGFKELFDYAYKKGAYFVMKNINSLKSTELDIQLTTRKSSVELEEELIQEHVSQTEYQTLSRELIQQFSCEKEEGEKVYDYEARIVKTAELLLGLNSKN